MCILFEVQKDLKDVFTGKDTLFKKNCTGEVLPHFDVKVPKVNFDLGRWN
jgi:hypothetical protein